MRTKTEAPRTAAETDRAKKATTAASLHPDFDLAGYLKHPGDKFGITATDAQMRAWSKAFKASPYDTLREWAAAALDAAARSQMETEVPK